ncbi:MAG: Mov34/MPN/PAD-1 family protein [Bryobacterales bacterium]|jgi:proteasome lid subunit RPN8/RPN11|nr:Mov34/MPN/PAD-1 family protein [Bryobacterales bacterium]
MKGKPPKSSTTQVPGNGKQSTGPMRQWVASGGGESDTNLTQGARRPPADWLGTPCPVVVDAAVVQAIRRHGRSSLDAEVCGVLIGEEIPEGTRIEAAIAGESAAQGGAHVTFTQDTWEHIYAVKDRDYPEKRIVGWYHTHPGFGIFLSKHDTFIHENFFSAPFQVAWVYDPHSEEEGCFGWVQGKLQRLGALRVIDTHDGDATEILEEPDPRPMSVDEDGEGDGGGSSAPGAAGNANRWRKRLVLLFALALVFVAGLAAGILVLPRTLVMYSFPDGRILSEAETREAIERARQWQRQQGAQPPGTQPRGTQPQGASGQPPGSSVTPEPADTKRTQNPPSPASSPAGGNR